MKKLIILLFIFTIGFTVPGNDYKQDASAIMRDITILATDKQNRDRTIYTAVPATTDGRVSEIRIVDLANGTSYYMYIKVGTSLWKRILLGN
jgi:hypothetical protein